MSAEREMEGMDGADAGGAGSEELRELPVDQIDPDPWQSRTRPEEPVALAGLAENIAAQGVLEPVRVRPSQTHPGRWWAYAGYRRVRAQQELRQREPGRWESIGCLVSPDKGDAEALLDSLAENIQRQDLSAVEMGAALLRLWEARGGTQEALAVPAGMHPGYVRTLIAGARIVQRCPELVAADREKPLPARLLKALPSDPELLRKIAELWREWGKESVEPLLRRIEQLRRGESPEIPDARGATRLERLRQCVSAVQTVRDPRLWELGPLTEVEELELVKLRIELREAARELERFDAGS
ncbi:MAG TPA: ParB/RepB/Spo0J family partition protein [Armatimonadota bacterium]|nr:ParB/RepB/Spo0J family partition protein [Armatimonadota bacterium]